MFRYSRDVKRCGPGTNAGAPVGVVYCLSTSSFFILTLTLELDVSAFGIGGSLATYSRRSAPAASTDLWARHRKPDDCEVTGLAPEAGPVKFSRVAAEPVRARLLYEGCRVSGLLGLDGRPRFGKALAHPVKNDLGGFAARFLDQFCDVPGILDCRFEHTLGQFRLLGRNFLRRTAWLEVSDQLPRLAPYLRQDFLLLRDNRAPTLRQHGRGLLHRLDVLAVDAEKRLVIDLRQINLLRHIGEHIHDCLVGHFSLLVSVDLCVELFYRLPTSLLGSHYSQTSSD